MSEKMPKVIYCTQWRSRLTGAIHRWYGVEPTNCDGEVAYQHPDTCTPNEECVSKAELEKAVEQLNKLRKNAKGAADGYKNVAGMTAAIESNLGKAQAYSRSLQILHLVLAGDDVSEVMDK